MNIAAAIEETLAAIDKLIEQKIAVGLLERLQKSVEQLKKEWVYKKLTQEDAALKLYQLQTDLLGTVRFGLSADIKASASQRKDIPNYLYSLLQNNPAFSSFNDESPREHHTQKRSRPKQQCLKWREQNHWSHSQRRLLKPHFRPKERYCTIFPTA